VRAACRDRADVAQKTAATSADDLNGRRLPTRRRGRVRRLTRSGDGWIANLAAFVETPAPHAAVGLERQRVVGTSAQSTHRTEANDLGRRRATARAWRHVGAQFTVPVGAPRPRIGAGAESTGHAETGL
jgi:hypothetical protein